MTSEDLVTRLNASEEYFDRGTSVLTEEHSGFRPSEEMYTVATHVAHVAQTVYWFAEGTFSPSGFNLDFETHERDAAAVTSLTEARRQLAEAFDYARERFSGRTPEELEERLPEGLIMGGRPRADVIGGIEEHTAHHRGALSVYARLEGLQPPMPYMDTPMETAGSA